MGNDRNQPWVSGLGQPAAAPDTERTAPFDAASQEAGLTPVPQARRNIGPTGTLAFSAVIVSDPTKSFSAEESEAPALASLHTQTETSRSHPESQEREQQRPLAAQELDMQALPHLVRHVVNPQATGETTLQSMMRPDLMPQGASDQRRFLSIERELSEDSAAIKFLEKRLNRLEKDSRIALAVAAFALLLTVVALLR